MGSAINIVLGQLGTFMLLNYIFGLASVIKTRSELRKRVLLIEKYVRQMPYVAKSIRQQLASPKSTDDQKKLIEDYSRTEILVDLPHKSMDEAKVKLEQIQELFARYDCDKFLDEQNPDMYQQLNGKLLKEEEKRHDRDSVTTVGLIKKRMNFVNLFAVFDRVEEHEITF